MLVRVDESGYDRFTADIDQAHTGLRHAADIIVRTHREKAATGNGGGLGARSRGIDGEYVGVVEDQVGLGARGAAGQRRSSRRGRRGAMDV
jgi:hypothetical protein